VLDAQQPVPLGVCLHSNLRIAGPSFLTSMQFGGIGDFRFRSAASAIRLATMQAERCPRSGSKDVDLQALCVSRNRCGRTVSVGGATSGKERTGNVTPKVFGSAAILVVALVFVIKYVVPL
jgi:hypothetical protein